MNRWVCKEVPLMSLPGSFLDITSFANWRQTSKTQMLETDLTIDDWSAYVREHVHISPCGICRAKVRTKRMFDCPQCFTRVCGNHVYACQSCDAHLCMMCATFGCC